MRNRIRKALSIALAVIMVVVSLSEQYCFVQKASADGEMTYTRESEMEDLVGLMNEFGIFVFDEMRAKSHQHSNAIANKVLRDPSETGGKTYVSGEFTIRTYLRGEGEQFVNYFRSFPEMAQEDNLMKIGYHDDILIVGSDNEITKPAAEYYVGNAKIESTGTVTKDEANSQYIDLANLQRSFGFYSGQLSELEEQGATSDLHTDQNNRTISTDLTSGTAVINLTAGDFVQGWNNRITVSTAGAVLVINVDLQGVEVFNSLPEITTVVEGNTVVRNENLYNHPETNRVIWNFIDSSQEDGNYRGEVVIGNFFAAGTVMIPYGKLTTNNGIDGLVIAEDADLIGECHRINPYSEIPAPQSISEADIELIKTYEGEDLSSMSPDDRNELLGNTEFTLYKQDGTTKVAGPQALGWNAAKNQAGVLFCAIDCGSSEDVYYFKLKETKAPAGYALSDVEVDCKVVRDANTGLLKTYYKRSTDGDSAYSEDFPQFENEKKQEIQPAVSIEDWTYGETASTPLVTGNTGEGKETIEYKEKDADDSTYTTTQPTEAGDYVVRVRIDETDNYQAAVSDETEFTINKAANTIKKNGEIETAEVMRGGKELELSTLVSNPIGSVSYEIIGDANGCTMEAGGTLISGNTTGTVTIRVTATGDVNHESGYVDIVVTVIDKKPITPSVDITGWDYGTTANAPTLADGSNPGNGQVTYEYKKKDADDSTYTTTVPEDAGDYTVRATIAETADFNGGSATKDFTIAKVQDPAEIESTDSVMRGGNTVDLSENVTGAVGTVTYRIVGDNLGCEIDANTGILTSGNEVGEVTVEVAITDSSNHIGKTGEIKVEVTDKTTINPEVSIEGWTYGETPNEPVLAEGGNPGNGKVTYEYKKKGALDTTYATTVPENAGDYVVRVTVDETADYNGGSDTCEFTIAKAGNPMEVANEVNVKRNGNTVNLSDYIVGAAGKITVSITGNAHGCFIAQNNNGDYIFRSGYGNWTGDVKVLVSDSGSDNYESGSQTITVHVQELNTINPHVQITGWTYGEYDATVNSPSLTVGSNPGNGKVIYEYKKEGADDKEYTTTVPTDAGNYYVRATVSETNRYCGAQTAKEFTIAKAAITPEVVISGKEYDGTTCTVSLKEGSNPGNGSVTYEYKKKDAPESEYTTTAPTDAGEYVVRAKVAETDNYNGKTTDAVEFIISRAKVTVTAPKVEKDYGDQDPEFKATVDGLKNNDTIVYVLNRASGEDAGPYTIWANGETTQGNYDVTFVTGSLTIKQVANGLDTDAEETSVMRGGNEINLSEFADHANGDVTYEYVSGPTDYTIENGTFVSGDTEGQVVIKVKAAGDKNHTAAERTVTIEITDKKNYDVTVTAAGGKYDGEEKEAVVTVKDEDGKEVSLSDEELVVKYKKKNETDDKYTTTAPTEAGEYDVLVTVAGTKEYNEVEKTATLTITPAENGLDTDDAETSVMRGDKTIDLSEYAAGADGKVTYEIVSDDALDCNIDKDGTFTSGNKTGEVTVKVKTDGDNNHKAAEKTITVTITDKDDIQVDVETKTTSYDGNQKPVTVTVTDDEGESFEYSDDDVVVEYKKTTENDDAYTTTAPTEAGEYDVRVTVKETENHNGKTVEADGALIIEKIPDPAVVTTDGGAVKTNENPGDDNSIDLEELVNGAEGNVHFSIDESETTATGTTIDENNNLIPGSVPGEVKVKVIIDESTNHEGKKTVITITVTEKDVEDLTVSTEDGTYGDEEPVEPSFTEPEGTNKTTITYSGTTEGGEEYGPSTEPPTEAGNYVVTVTCETSDTIYTGTSDFTIEKATPELGTVTVADLHETTDVADAVFSRTDTTVSGKFTLEETALSSGTNTYHYTFTPDDTANYETVKGTVTITVTEHQWGDWYVVEDATTEKSGLKRRDCDLCDEYETEEIPKLEPEEPNQENPNGGTQEPNQENPNGGTQEPNQENPNGGTQEPNQENPNGGTQEPNQENPNGGTQEPNQENPNGGTQEPNQQNPNPPAPNQENPNQQEPNQETPNGGGSTQETVTPNGGTDTSTSTNPPQGGEATGTGEGGTKNGESGTATDTSKATDTTPATDTSKSTDTTPATDTSKSTDTAPATDTSKSTDTTPATDTSKSADTTPATDTSKSTDTPKDTDTSKKTDTPSGSGETDTKTPRTGDAGLLVWWLALLGAATVVLMVRKQQADAEARKVEE